MCVGNSGGGAFSLLLFDGVRSEGRFGTAIHRSRAFIEWLYLGTLQVQLQQPGEHFPLQLVS